MKLLDSRLYAFFEIGRLNSFTKAADFLGLTQPALSHRIRKLEEELGVSLFVREASGLLLTEAGIKLFQYCRMQSQVEGELIRALTQSESNQLAGALRIGSVSSLAWSVVTPAIAGLIRKNPDIHLDLMAREVAELPLLLKRGYVDFIITVDRSSEPSLQEYFLAMEQYVLVEPERKTTRKQVYLDHEEADKFTAEYLAFQGKKEERLTRSYMDDNHGLLAGVRAGLGKAVVPKHLLTGEPGIKICKNQKPLEKPIYLYHAKQPYYSKLHTMFVKTIVERVPQWL